MLTTERLKEVLEYDPVTGIFIHRAGRLQGQIAGNVKPKENNRIILYIDGNLYKAHILAWLYMTGEWPARQIDHEDRNPNNNKWENLREATQSSNTANKLHTPGQSGVRGVDMHGRKWRAKIKINGKRKYLGVFNTIEEASKAYQNARREYFGNFNPEEMFDE